MSADLTDRSIPGQVKEVEVAFEIMQGMRPWRGHAKDSLYPVGVGVTHREVVLGVSEFNCIERLLVLTPDNIADKCGIVPDDSLATDGSRESVLGVSQKGLVQFVVVWVPDKGVAKLVGVCESFGGAATNGLQGSWQRIRGEVVNKRVSALAFDEDRKAIEVTQSESEPSTHRECVGGLEVLFITEFVAGTEVTGELDIVHKIPTAGIGQRCQDIFFVGREEG